jgi:hypothetical protein
MTFLPAEGEGAHAKQPDDGALTVEDLMSIAGPKRTQEGSFCWRRR